MTGVGCRASHCDRTTRAVLSDAMDRSLLFRSARQHWPWWSIGLVVVAAVVANLGAPLLQDEEFHFREIRHRLRGRLGGELPMFPGYHLLMVASARALGWTSIAGLRLLSWFWSVASLGAIYYAARAVDAGTASLRTLQLLLMPLVLPIVALLYTDVVSLGACALALGLLLRRHVFAAGVAATLSLGIRQSNIAWLLFLLAISIWREFRARRASSADDTIPARRWWGPFLLRHAGFALGCLLFVGFVLRNGGLIVSTSPAAAERTLSGAHYLHVENGLLAVVLCAFFLLPRSITATKEAVSEIRRQRLLLLLPIACVAIALLAFRADHEWNRVEPGFYLINAALLWAKSSAWSAAVALTLLFWGTCLLVTLPLHGEWGWPLLGFWAAATLAIGLVAPRYELPVIAAVFLLRRHGPPELERWVTVWLALLGIAASVGVRFDLYSSL